ncbi:hypothetical protein PGR10_06345 [Klebsiella sp. 141198]|uniref:hypothetical protein n=1 Tax=Klebsiella sp. 141198 TaxID=3020036 RepID=UPI003D357B47|nr:hypothetical protein [Klebsiella aerogenes]
MKFWNNILLSTVLVLFIVAIVTFIKVLGYGTGITNLISTIEVGSLTDIISSLSTLGTLVIAYLAYKSAPLWIREKQNEEGFNHVSSMLRDYDSIVLELRNIYWDVFPGAITVSNQQEIRNNINKCTENYFSLESKLKACKRWKIEYPLEVETHFKKILDFYSKALDVAAIQQFGDYNRAFQLQQDLTGIRDEIINDREFFLRDIDDIFKFQQ